MKMHGFSLFELMISLVIISILAGISYPVYTNHLITAHRAQAKTTLLSLAAQLEAYYALHHSYRGVSLASFNSNNPFYSFEASVLTDESYQLRAVPKNSQTKDTLCKVLTLNANGKKTSSGSGTYQECW